MFMEISATLSASDHRLHKCPKVTDNPALKFGICQ